MDYISYLASVEYPTFRICHLFAYDVIKIALLSLIKLIEN